jgi:hypothetical protein
MKKLIVLVLILITSSLSGTDLKIKDDYLVLNGSLQISDTEYFITDDYKSINIHVYYDFLLNPSNSEIICPKCRSYDKSVSDRSWDYGECRRGHKLWKNKRKMKLLTTTVPDKSGNYRVQINLKYLNNNNIITQSWGKYIIQSDDIHIKIESGKYNTDNISYGLNNIKVNKNTSRVNPIILTIKDEWLYKSKMNNLEYEVDKLDGPYNADGFTNFFADGNNYFIWNTKDSKRGMYRSVDSGENWERMTWDGIGYIPSIIYKYDGEYLFHYKTEDNLDGVWNSYDYDKKVWSVYEIDEFELKIFNAEKENWEKKFKSQKSKQFPVTRKDHYYGKRMAMLNYKNYKYNLFLPYKKWYLQNIERREYENWELTPLLSGTIYEIEDDVFLLNTYGLYKLINESDMIITTNYNKTIHDYFKKTKSFVESELKGQLLPEIITKYEREKNRIISKKESLKNYKKDLKTVKNWLTSVDGWEKDTTIILVDNKRWRQLNKNEKRKFKLLYKERKGGVQYLEYNINSITDYLRDIKVWISDTEVQIDSLNTYIVDEIHNFPMFYPIPTKGIYPSEISDVKIKNNKVYVNTSLNNGLVNKLFVYDDEWNTVFDPFIDDFESDSKTSIEMLDNVDDIIFISPSSKTTSLPNNIYYLNTQDNNTGSKYELFPHRDETGRSIDYAFTDKSGNLWTIQKKIKSQKGGNWGNRVDSYPSIYQLYRYKSLKDLSNPLLIQEWNRYSGDGDKYNPETQVVTSSWDKPPIRSIKLVKTEDSKIYFIKDNSIKQIGADRDKNFIFTHYPSSVGLKGSINQSLGSYVFSTLNNDLIMFNNSLYLGRDYRRVQGQGGYDFLLHIQRGVNIGFIDEETYEYFEERSPTQYKLRYTPSKSIKYKFRCSIGNNDEMLIYNYLLGVKYLRKTNLERMEPLDYFDKMRVSEITNNKNGYIIGTYNEGLYKVSIISN